jgi:hypothetical protein
MDGDAKVANIPDVRPVGDFPTYEGRKGAKGRYFGGSAEPRITTIGPVPRLWAAMLVILVACLLASMVIAIVKLS